MSEAPPPPQPALELLFAEPPLPPPLNPAPGQPPSPPTRISNTWPSTTSMIPVMVDPLPPFGPPPSAPCSVTSIWATQLGTTYVSTSPVYSNTIGVCPIAEFAKRKGSKNAIPMIETCLADFMVAGYDVLNLSVFLGANGMTNVYSLNRPISKRFRAFLRKGL